MSELVRWLQQVARSRPNSTFAIFTDNAKDMRVDVLKLVEEACPDAVRYRRSYGSITHLSLFDRRVFVITSEKKLLGLSLDGYYIHSKPRDVRIEMIESRLRYPATDGQPSAAVTQGAEDV